MATSEGIEMNESEGPAPDDPQYAARRERLKRLAPRYGYLYSGPPEDRWPMRPGRYLIDGFDYGWHGDEWQDLADSLEAVRVVLSGLSGHEVLSVIDLDTGDEVPFERHVSVSI